MATQYSVPYSRWASAFYRAMADLFGHLGAGGVEPLTSSLEDLRRLYEELRLEEMDAAEEERIRVQGLRLAGELENMLKLRRIAEDDPFGRLAWDIIDEAENLSLSLDPRVRQDLENARREFSFASE